MRYVYFIARDKAGHKIVFEQTMPNSEADYLITDLILEEGQELHIHPTRVDYERKFREQECIDNGGHFRDNQDRCHTCGIDLT